MRFALPDLPELIYRSSVVSIPFILPFRGIRNREVMLLTNGGRVGEWAAFPEYSDEISASWLASALEQAYTPARWREGEGTESVPVNATFPALHASALPRWWARFPGSRSAKIKVAESRENIEDSIYRLKALRAAVGEEISLRIDANGMWTVDQAEEALIRLQLMGFRIDYVEQPVETLSELSELRSRLAGAGIKLAADELIRHSSNPVEVFASGVADVAVLKVSTLGGIENTLYLARQAHDAGLDVVVSSALETSIGLSWGIRAACVLRQELGALPDAGLGTAVFFEQDIVSHPILVSSGKVFDYLPRVDAAQIRKFSASSERREWWLERFKRCLPLAMQMLESRPS